jgi:hypothetical protein
MYTPAMDPIDPPLNCLFCRWHMGYDPPCIRYNGEECQQDPWVTELWNEVKNCRRAPIPEPPYPGDPGTMGALFDGEIKK